MFGLLNIDKPYDVTSRDVVNHVQRFVRPQKVGHAGTLDPLATGVLLVCVGPATRLNEFVQDLAKQYLGTFQLGRRSDTEDTEGEVEVLHDVPEPTREEVEQVLGRFRGQIMQRPPAFSALKVKGKRAYALARRGKQVALEPRPVTVHAVDVVRYEYPELVLDVTCGSGTYIRSLGRDIGEALHTAAVMSDLRRTAVGPFTIETACCMRELNAETICQHLLPPAQAVAHLPTILVSAEQIEELSHGRYIAGALPDKAKLGSALDAAGKLIALLAPAPDGGLKPHRFFRTA